ncbi:hypothetical protein CAAN1_22S02036 [[Candida] anglica]|uniref:DUF218 domain-containing protein n=1 Tax=[Candida] anglica TaxID=148631 RepID=A0ABP0EDT0_9ASCO
MNHLVILPCHSVWLGGDSKGQSRDEWILAPFQIEGNDHLCFIEHITASIELLQRDPGALLVISGGQTKTETPLTESESYATLAQNLFDGSDSSVFSRVVTEKYARDSMENVIFSICRFYEEYHKYPEKVTVVGFEFKRNRFVNHHFAALLWPLEHVEYVGNCPDPREYNDEERAAYFDDLDACEYKFAVQCFAKDWFGATGSLLKKKETRNPHGQRHTYSASNARLGAFFRAVDEQGANEEIQESLQGVWN